VVAVTKNDRKQTTEKQLKFNNLAIVRQKYPIYPAIVSPNTKLKLPK
jgi:hypothetical protein